MKRITITQVIFTIVMILIVIYMTVRVLATKGPVPEIKSTPSPSPIATVIPCPINGKCA